MKKIFLKLILVVLCIMILIISVNFIQHKQNSKFILENTLKNEKELEKYIKNDPVALVYFFSPECSYCKRFQKKLVSKLKKLETNNIEFYCFDVSTDKEIMKEKYNLEYVPTLVLYKESKEDKKLVDEVFDEKVIDKFFEYVEALHGY